MKKVTLLPFLTCMMLVSSVHAQDSIPPLRDSVAHFFSAINTDEITSGILAEKIN